MALSDLIYRCPACGFDPTEGEGDAVSCPACDVRYARGHGDMLLQVKDASGPPYTTTVAEVVAKIEEWGGPLSRAVLPNGSVRYSADVLVSWRVSEDPVRHKGQLRGFSELMGSPVPAVLSVDDDEARISGDAVSPENWPYLTLRSLQTSSSSVQLSLPERGLVQFEFVRDSPRRWEELLRHLVKEAYRRAGRGIVVEFQPRIVTKIATK